jgi:hypothetical protein
MVTNIISRAENQDGTPLLQDIVGHGSNGYLDLKDEHQMPSSPTMPAYSTLLATNLCKLHILCKHGSGSSFINPTMVAADDSILGPCLFFYYLLNASPIPTTMKGGGRLGQQRD